MDITTQEFKRASLISVSGRMDATTSPALEVVLRRLLSEQRFKLVLDLSKCDYVSSAGIKVLVAVQKEAKRFNRGELALCGLQTQVRETLDLVGLIPLFAVYDTPLQAVGNI
jgi:anti-sigma B factor antagonist